MFTVDVFSVVFFCFFLDLVSISLLDFCFDFYFSHLPKNNNFLLFSLYPLGPPLFFPLMFPFLFFWPWLVRRRPMSHRLMSHSFLILFFHFLLLDQFRLIFSFFLSASSSFFTSSTNLVKSTCSSSRSLRSI